MFELIANALSEAWWNFLNGLALFVPRVLAALSILVVGWLTAWLLQRLTRWALGVVRFNALTERAGGAEMLRRTGLPPAETSVASLVFWTVLVGFLLSGVSALGMQGMDSVLSDFLHFIPRLLVALVILGVGFAIANFVWRATLLAAVNAQLPSARLLSAAARFLIMILAVAMALEQVAVARTVVLTAFAIAFGAVMLGIAIAVGIGGSGVAKRLLEEQFVPREPREPRDPDRMSHL